MSKGMSCKRENVTDSETSCNLDESDRIIKSRMKTTTTSSFSIIPPKRCASRGTSTASDPVNTRKVEDTDAFKEEFDVEEEIATDNLLGRLRNGIRLIQVHARETMADCDTDDSRVDMAKRLESATIGMLRAEKSFMNTASIIADVVDEYASDFEEHENEKDDEDEDDPTGNTLPSQAEVDESAARQVETDDSSQPKEYGDQRVEEKESIIPIFRPTVANGASIRNYGRKLSKIMLKRLSNYENSLTDDILRGEKKFLTLKEQIRFGALDSENKIKKRMACLGAGAGDTDDYTLTTSYSRAFDDEEDYDESVLPSLDPITRQPIFNAVRNKFCNHVFDEQSILSFMLEFPDKRCPMDGCLNERHLSPGQFVEEIQLSERIRRKNDKYAAYS